MGKRGMLPKFRPATLGRDASVRPSIRPVRPSPPPPPPSPPRKQTSGVSARSNLAPFPGPATERDDGTEMPTVTGHAEPATLSRGGPSTVPFEQAQTNRRPRAELPSEPISFEDETQARATDDGLLDRLRMNQPAAAGLGVDYESLPSLEVRRPYDTYEGEFSERDPVTQLHGARARDLESASVRRADKAAYREPSYNEPPYSAPAPAQNDVWARREGSGPRERPAPSAPASYAAPVPAYDDASISAQWGRDAAEPSQQPATWSEPAAQNDAHYDEPMIPPAPRVPEEMHPAFVVGVQPIRTATPDAWGTPHAMAPQQGQYVPAPMQMQAYGAQPQYQAQPQHYTQPPQQQAYAQAPQQYPSAQPAPYAYPSAAPSQPAAAYLQQQSGPHVRDPRYASAAPSGAPMHASGMSPSMMQRRQPLAAQLEPAPNTGKVGRFAWFVAGAAFGITFAFFATGFFTASAPKDEFPAAPALTAAAPVAPPVQAAAPVAPPVAAAPVAPPVAAAPVAPPVAAPVAAAPVAAPVAPPVAAPVAPPVAAVPAAAPVAPAAAIPAAALPAAAPVAAAPVRPAPPPARPRFQAPPPRRPAAPASQAPKNLGGGGPGADDERSPAPSAPAGSDIGDLLGAGLKP